MSKVKTFIKKYYIPIWIVLAFVILSTSTITYAIFTRDNKAKRVIATLPGTGNQFSSNYLTNDSEDIYKYAYFGSGGNSLSAYVTICNYAQGGNKPFEKNIPYTIDISLIDENGDTVDPSSWIGENAKSIIIYRTAQGSSTETEVHRFDSTHTSGTTLPATEAYVLERGDTSTDSYRIVFNNFDIEADDYSPVYVNMVATPQINNVTGIDTLYGAITVSKRGTGEVTGWDGDFNDDKTNKTAADYDDFNYVISGTGSGWFAFAWDSSYLEMNKIFYDEIIAVSGSNATQYGIVTNSDVTITDNGKTLLSLTAANHNGWKYVVFHVDSSVNDRYSFQLYKKENKTSTDYATFNQLNGYVITNFTKS